MVAKDSLFTEAETFPQLLMWGCEKYGGKKLAMRYKQFGVWQPYTWKDYYEGAKYLSLGLISLGLEAGDKVTIIGDNQPEWFYAELGAQAGGAVVVGIFSDAATDEIKYIAGHSGSKFTVAGDQEQVDKFLQIKDELPNLKKIIYWDAKGLLNYDEPMVIGFRQVLELGKEYEEAHPGLFEQKIERGKGSDLALLLYTSGTLALPKGAMLTYDEMMAMHKAQAKRNPWRENDQEVSFVSPAWIAEQWFGIVGPLLEGTVINFPEEPETVQADIREVGPTTIFYGSRLWESLVSTVQAKMADASSIKRFIYGLLLPVAYKVEDSRLREQKLNLIWKALYSLTNIALLRPLRDQLGLSKARNAYNSGATLSPDTFRFFHAIGIDLKQLYAATECGACCTHGDDMKDGTVGRPLSGVEVRIGNDGEILVRSNIVFSGYYKDPEKTTEAIKDGWFCSGDAGYIDEEGHLIFLDRVADLAELATGEKIAPQYIESRLKFSPYIKDVMVIGEKDQTFVSAIVNIDFENVGRWAESKHITYTTMVDLSQKPEVYDLTQKDIERVNRFLPPSSRVRKYTHLHKEFDPDEAELTRSRKLRRGFMMGRYKEVVDAIYGDKMEVPVEAAVKYRDGRTGVLKTTIKIRSVGEGN